MAIGSINSGVTAARPRPVEAAAASLPTRREAPAAPQQQTISAASWLAGLALADVAAAISAGMLGFLLRFRDGSPTVHGVSYMTMAAVLPAVWVSMLFLAGAYDRRFIAAGTDQFRRVLNTGLVLLAMSAFFSFALQLQISRVFVAVTIPGVTAATLLVRYACRKALHMRLINGAQLHRVVVVGSSAEARNLIRHVRRNQWAGFTVVGACTLDVGDGMPRGVVHLTPSLDTLASEVAELQADTIAIAGTRMLDHGDLRRIAWRVEGRGVNLVVVPEVIDFAGPRIEIRPVDGLPLLHIDEPEFTGFKRWLKGAFDRVAASIIALIVSPLLLGIAVAILVTEGRPIFYRQERVGKAGESFKLWKFRTMTKHAEHQLQNLLHLNEHDGFLFKIRDDPRVTPVGRWLRRHSLDEMPQLWNVINGSMSLVGPRPPLASEVEHFGDDMRRRLLVKPGMTGLWQVNGRADLPWEEAVQLDLHYVENWSVMMDFVVLWKTLRVVVEGRGGY